MKNNYTARNEAIVHRYSNGESMKDLAIEFGLSRERIRQIISRHKDNIIYQGYYSILYETGQKYDYSLEMVYRLYNFLITRGIFNKALTHEKELYDYADEELLSMFGFGEGFLKLYKLAFRKENHEQANSSSYSKA